MQRLIVGNWKMNLNLGEASLLLHRLQEKITPDDNTGVVICPSALHLIPLAKDLKSASKIKLGAQNLHHQDQGPHTGEISGSQLRDVAGYVIVGHSERRATGETDKLIALKLAAAIRNGLRPILCVGETLEEREHGLAEKVVVDQLTAALSGIAADDMTDLTVAYEPVWAINHHDGRAIHHAAPDDIRFAYRAIRTTIEELYGEEGIQGLRLLYGGSTDPDHCLAYLKMPHVDGLLVGTDSLNYESFSKIVKVAQSL